MLFLGKRNNFDPRTNLIEDSVIEASSEVDRAISDTVKRLFNKEEERTSPHQLLRRFRFPQRNTIQLAKAAEIYERTLNIIKKHSENGRKFNITGGKSMKA